MKTLLLVLLFAVLVMLVWKFWKPTPKRVVPPNEAKFYFFYTDWCGFSQKALPIWDSIEESLQGNALFGKTRVTPVRVNAEEDRETTTLYEVQGYPTMMLETSDSLYKYEGKRTKEDLLQFLRDKLGQETKSL
jgi:thiol-disulfide isomerase/thioredoxin